MKLHHEFTITFICTGTGTVPHETYLTQQEEGGFNFHPESGIKKKP
jgi:hypothetical protein